MEIPGYQIEELIAEGGMSSVYLAIQESLGRKVAIKVLRKFDNAQQAERFLHEARVIASLEHRNVITIYDVGAVGERYYIAMEYLENGSLAERIEHGMEPNAALDLLNAIAGCLDFVHQHGIVHRDIKPSNILFHADGTPKLSDFGIAKQLDANQELTLEDSALGSPYYLSPEQAEGRPLDGRSDIYSLGIVFYQMLTGRRPYAESSHIETIVAHLSNPIPLLPKHLSQYQGLLEWMIAKTPDSRIASAEELGDLIHKLRSKNRRWSDGLRAGTGLAPVSGEQATESGSLMARLRGAATGGTLAGATLLLLIAILFAWMPDEDVVEAPAQPLASRSAGIELRYGQGSGSVAQKPESPPPVKQPPAVPPAAAAKPREPVQGYTAWPEQVRASSAPQRDADDIAADLLDPADAEQTRAAVEEQGSVVVAAAPDDREPIRASVAEAVETDATAPAADTEAQTESADAQQARIDALMQAADRAIKADRLTRPRDTSAFALYSEVLAIEPGHPGAEEGLDRIADRYADLARTSLGKKDHSKARLYVRRGLMVRDTYDGLLAVLDEIEESERLVASAAAVTETVAVPPPPKKKKVVSREFEDTSVTSSGTEGSGNIVKDFKKVWRSVFD